MKLSQHRQSGAPGVLDTGHNVGRPGGATSSGGNCGILPDGVALRRRVRAVDRGVPYSICVLVAVPFLFSFMIALR